MIDWFSDSNGRNLGRVRDVLKVCCFVLSRFVGFLFLILTIFAQNWTKQARNFSGLDLAFCKSYKLRGLPCCYRQEIPNGFGKGNWRRELKSWKVLWFHFSGGLLRCFHFVNVFFRLLFSLLLMSCLLARLVASLNRKLVGKGKHGNLAQEKILTEIYLAIETNTIEANTFCNWYKCIFQLIEIYFAIETNLVCNWDKYIWQ